MTGVTWPDSTSPVRTTRSAAFSELASGASGWPMGGGGGAAGRHGAGRGGQFGGVRGAGERSRRLADERRQQHGAECAVDAAEPTATGLRADEEERAPGGGQAPAPAQRAVTGGRE